MSLKEDQLGRIFEEHAAAQADLQKAAESKRTPPLSDERLAKMREAALNCALVGGGTAEEIVARATTYLGFLSIRT